MLDLAATVMELHGSPAPTFHWAYLNCKPRIKRARKIKDEYITQLLKDRVEISDHAIGKPPSVTCAVDQMILRERSLAKRDGREPRLFSRVMMDEVRTLASITVRSALQERSKLTKLRSFSVSSLREMRLPPPPFPGLSNFSLPTPLSKVNCAPPSRALLYPQIPITVTRRSRKSFVHVFLI